MSMKAKKHLNFEATHLAMKWNESSGAPLLTQPYILKHVALLHSPPSLSILHIHFSSLDFSYIFSLSWKKSIFLSPCLVHAVAPHVPRYSHLERTTPTSHLPTRETETAFLFIIFRDRCVILSR